MISEQIQDLIPESMGKLKRKSFNPSSKVQHQKLMYAHVISILN